MKIIKFNSSKSALFSLGIRFVFMKSPVIEWYFGKRWGWIDFFR